MCLIRSGFTSKIRDAYKWPRVFIWIDMSASVLRWRRPNLQGPPGNVRAHVRVTACVCTGHAVTLTSISARTCAPLFDVRLSLCLDKWAAASPTACRASDQPVPSGADTVVQAVEEDRHILAANVKQHFHSRPLMWCIGSGVSRVIISQQASQAAIFFFFLFVSLFFLLNQCQVYLQIIKCRW